MPEAVELLEEDPVLGLKAAALMLRRGEPSGLGDAGLEDGPPSPGGTEEIGEVGMREA